jgi:hypothetical protein
MLEQGIKVVEEDVLYNWTNSTIMTISSSRKPLRVGKELHPLTFEALIGAYSKLESFVVDFVMSTGMYCYLHFIVALHFHFRI